MVVANTDYPFVTGPSSAVDSDAASFDGTSGRVLKDAGSGAGNVTGPGSSTTNDLPKFADTTGKVLSDSGILASNVVQGPASATDGNLAVWNGTTGKLLKDGGSAAGGFIQASKVNLTGGDFSTSSTNFADLTGATITITTGAHRCIIFASLSGNITVAAPNSAFLSLVIDGTTVGGTGGNISSTAAATGQGFNLSISYLTDVLSAGSHTFKLQVKTSGGTLGINSGASEPTTFSVIETGLTA